MAEKLEDLNLPNASVQKIIKEVLPESVNIGKDARAALSRAASVFVLFITSQASKEAQSTNRKTISGNDVLKALKELEFEDFIEPLEDILNEYKESKKKDKSVADKKEDNSKLEETVESAGEDEADDAEIEENT